MSKKTCRWCAIAVPQECGIIGLRKIPAYDTTPPPNFERSITPPQKKIVLGA